MSPGPQRLDPLHGGAEPLDGGDAGTFAITAAVRIS